MGSENFGTRAWCGNIEEYFKIDVVHVAALGVVSSWLNTLRMLSSKVLASKLNIKKHFLGL